MDEPKKILVRAPNWIGDQILAYPFFYYLRKAYPSAHITSVCVPWVQSVQFRNCVDEVILLPRSLRNSWLSKWEAIEITSRVLRKSAPWDLGIALPHSFSAAWLLYRAQTRVRRGFATDGRSFFLNQALPRNLEIPLHRSEEYVALLPKEVQPKRSALEFWGIPPENDLDSGVPGVESSFDAEKAWPQAEPLDPPSFPFWILAPGTTADSRRWPVSSFLELARQIYLDTGWTGIILGGPAEAEAARYLTSDPTLKLLDWTGRGGVASHWKAFQKAKLSVCNDSGLAHLASLCGSPVQVVWGAGNLARTRPIGPGKVRVIFNPVECWPCERNSCSQVNERKFECIKGIEPYAVWKELKTGI